MKITVVGGTGYAGSHIVREAASRGHEVVALSRHAPQDAARVEGVEYRELDVTSPDALAAAVAGAEVVVSALSPRGGLDGQLVEVDRRLADLVAQAGGRLLVVGGFSSLRREAGGPRVIDEGFGPEPGADVPGDLAALVSEATQMNQVLVGLLGREDDLAWTFFSPGMEFGAHVPGTATGRYRIAAGGTVLADDAGRTVIGGADFATAVVDEADRAAHPRAHVAVAY